MMNGRHPYAIPTPAYSQAMPQPSPIMPQNQGMPPNADMQMMQSANTSPASSWTEGMGRVANALALAQQMKGQQGPPMQTPPSFSDLATYLQNNPGMGAVLGPSQSRPMQTPPSFTSLGNPNQY